MTFDITLVEENFGLVLHTPDCPAVGAARLAGKPLATLLGCDGTLETMPLRLIRHDCLARPQAEPPRAR